MESRSLRPPATGFTDRLFSVTLAEANEQEPIVAGDVVTTPEGNLTIRATGADIGGNFYVDLEYVQLTEPQVGVPFKLLRQAGISGADQAKPTFYPDQLGFYIFDLRVNDGELDSAPSARTVRGPWSTSWRARSPEPVVWRRTSCSTTCCPSGSSWRTGTALAPSSRP